jgi:hypothetical protein
LIGKRIRVHWVKVKKWYEASVDAFDLNKGGGKHHIVYVDAEDEWGKLNTSKMIFEVTAKDKRPFEFLDDDDGDVPTIPLPNPSASQSAAGVEAVALGKKPAATSRATAAAPKTATPKAVEKAARAAPKPKAATATKPKVGSVPARAFSCSDLRRIAPPMLKKNHLAYYQFNIRRGERAGPVATLTIFSSPSTAGGGGGGSGGGSGGDGGDGFEAVRQRSSADGRARCRRRS